MTKMLFYSLFGLGKLPSKRRRELEREGILLAEEGIRATVTFRNYRCPAFVATWRRRWVGGSVVLTRKRFATYAFFSLITLVDIPVLELPNDHFRVCANGPVTSVTFDADHYLPGHSGIVTVQFRSLQADAWRDTAHAGNAIG